MLGPLGKVSGCWPNWGAGPALKLAALLEAHAIWTFGKEPPPGEHGYFPHCREAHVFEMDKNDAVDGSLALGPEQLVDRVNSDVTNLRFAVVRMAKRLPTKEPGQDQKTHTIDRLRDECEEGILSLLRLLWFYGTDDKTLGEGPVVERSNF